MAALGLIVLVGFNGVRNVQSLVAQFGAGHGNCVARVEPASARVEGAQGVRQADTTDFRVGINTDQHDLFSSRRAFGETSR